MQLKIERTPTRSKQKQKLRGSGGSGGGSGSRRTGGGGSNGGGAAAAQISVGGEGRGVGDGDGVEASPSASVQPATHSIAAGAQRVYQSVNKMPTLLKLLVEYDESERGRIFDSSQVQCLVCFVEKPGKYVRRYHYLSII